MEIIVAHPVSHQLLVHTQGNVQPRREIDLVTQVTGNVIFASNHFADGGFFDKAELLVSIEQDDYLIAEQQ
ncbi:efflux transporter periplasmic adaptor subunit, partial [bacterium AH-315-K03]|nr:efflux transporter periplasmic adaptor subunit [bacterium AH-315-K03]